MEERGVGYLADMLVFALLISLASLLLLNASPVDPRTESTRYSSSFAQSTLLALQNSTADEFGGFEYQLSVLGHELNLPVLGDSAKRTLHHKTPVQLLVEEALLNLHVEAEGAELETFKLSEGMGGEVREFLKRALDKLIGGRFGYRLTVKTSPVELDSIRVHFNDEIKNLDEGAQRKLCSETIVATLPIPRGELTQRIEGVLGTASELEPDPAVEITLELWSQ